MSEDDTNRRFEEIVRDFEREGMTDIPWSSGELIHTIKNMEPALKLACNAVNAANEGTTFTRDELERAVALSPADFTTWAIQHLLTFVEVATMTNLNMATVRHNIKRLLAITEDR